MKEISKSVNGDNLTVTYVEVGRIYEWTTTVAWYNHFTEEQRCFYARQTDTHDQIRYDQSLRWAGVTGPLWGDLSNSQRATVREANKAHTTVMRLVALGKDTDPSALKAVSMSKEQEWEFVRRMME